MSTTRSESENKVTTEGYWDDVWSPLRGRVGKLNPTDFYFGRTGVFSKLVNEQLGDISGKTVIEFGGGGNNFRLLAMAKWLGARVTVVDYSEEGLRIVKELFNAHGCEATFLKADIYTWVPPEQYDFVVHWGVLEHFVDPTPILVKSAEALKPGGSLLFTMPNLEAAATRFWAKWSPSNWALHVFHPTDVVNARLGELGFHSMRTFYFGVPFFKMVEWEVKSVWQYPVNVMQKLGSAAARIVPGGPRMGHRLISMERCFCARKGT